MKADFIDTRFGEDNASIPALGIAWSYCVNTRISLHRNTAAIRATAVPTDDDGIHTDKTHTERIATGGNVKVEPGSVGTKRGFDSVSPVGATHAYSRVFDDSIYADTSSNECVGRTNGNVAACMSAEPNGTDKENSSVNVDTAASVTVVPVKVETLSAFPRAIKYYRNVGVGADGDEDDTHRGGSAGVARSTRCIRLDFSPCKASAECAYEITHAGIHGVTF